MGHSRGFRLPAIAIATAALVAGCSSSQDKTSQGSLSVKLEASRLAARAPSASAVADDPIARLLAANVTISETEARKTDGAWVPSESVPPAVVDLLALANGGGSVTLPPSLLPEGQYNALQVRITQLSLTLLDGSAATIAPPGTGWVVRIPVDFGVVSGQAMVVALDVRLDPSFKLVNGELEFEPDVEVAGVAHD